MRAPGSSIVLALAAGLALGWSAPPREVVWPALAFGAALMIACEPFVAERRWRQAFGVGLASGIAFGALALTWVTAAVLRFSHYGRAVAWAATGATILLEALAPALACALYVRLAPRRRSPWLFAASLAFAFHAVPMLFPWRPIAMALPFRELAQWLAIGGPSLADFVVALPLCLVVDAALAQSGRRAAVALLVTLLAIGGGAAFLAAHPTPTHRVRVAVIQPNVPLSVGLDRHRRGERLALLRETTRRLSTRADIVLWPESAHPYVLDRDRDTDLPAPHDVGAPADVTVVVGAMTQRGRCARWNGVVAFREGRVVGRVDKERRMPFGDYLPWREVLGRPSCRDLRPAEYLSFVPVAEHPGAMLCYDEVEPGPARERVRSGAGWLAGFTNDAWYDATRQPWLHERMARMRAVETGRDLVRAVNTGLSAWIGPDGRVRARLDENVRGHLVLNVPIRAEITPYVRIGDAFGAALGLALVAVAIADARDQRKRSTSSGGGR